MLREDEEERQSLILKQIDDSMGHIKEAIAKLNEINAPAEVLLSYCVFKKSLEGDVKSLLVTGAISNKLQEAQAIESIFKALRRDS